MRPSHTVWATTLCVVLAASLVSSRPSPEAEAGYRSPDDLDDDVATLNSEARSQNSISAEERAADLQPQPYGALKLAVTEEPWGALKVAVALAEQDRQASQLLNKERDSVEVVATPEPDTEVVESDPNVPAVEPAGDSPNGPTTLVLRPYAKAVAGAGGTAIAMPESQAITRREGDIVVFEPRAIAVVGPGGHAVASSKLIIDTFIHK